MQQYSTVQLCLPLSMLGNARNIAESSTARELSPATG